MKTTKNSEPGSKNQRLGNDTSSPCGEEAQSLDVAFDVLRNRRRRLVLRYLRAESGQATLSGIAEHVAALENDIDVRQLNSQQRKRVYISLYQSHLPKLDDVGAIQFDQDRGSVSLDEEADTFFEFLDGPAEESTPENATSSPRTQTAAAAGVAVAYGTAMAAGWTIAASLVVFLFLAWFAFDVRRSRDR